MDQRVNGRVRLRLGMRGIVAGELKVEGGDWGGPAERALFSADVNWIDSPVWRLIWALNTLKNPDGRILIEGFYDDVRVPTPEEKELFEKV